MTLPKIPQWKDKILFTPGPLITSPTVKQAVLRDLGSRDYEFMHILKKIQNELLKIGHVQEKEYQSILLQGSGTYGMESVITSITPPNQKWLFIVNGAYGRRMVQIAEALHIEHISIEFEENQYPDVKVIKSALQEAPEIQFIGMVHSETSTGMFNPIHQVGQLAKQYQKIFFVDAMSSFGGVLINILDCNIDFLVSSANKCIEGLPGFTFIIARKDILLTHQNYSRSVCLDLFAQWKNFQDTGQFRFTPPTHTLLAFYQALKELNDEGGVEGRALRYTANHKLLMKGMQKMGFEPFLKAKHRGYIITSFRYPNDPNFDFKTFYNALNERDIVIYPGKVSQADCFRIGHIGRIFKADILNLLSAIQATVTEMNLSLIKR